MFSKLKSISGFEAELALYSAYLEIKQNPEKLDGFIHLAPLILSDFNLIDKYLLDANQFISNINAVNEIENWSLNKKELTDNQINFIDFWKDLGSLYHHFNSQIIKRGLSSEGNIYKTVSLNIEKASKKTQETHFFIGLNALSKSEEKIIAAFLKNKTSKIYFDGDQYYTNNKQHEAGYFYRKSTLFNKINQPANFTSKPKQISIHKTGNDLEQVQLAASIIEKENIDTNSCAIYLINENVINPLIQNIPSKIKSLNITMGFPINNGFTYGFLIELLGLFDQRNSKDLWEGNKLNYQFIESLFLLPFFKKEYPGNLIDTPFWQNIIEKNIKFIDLNRLIKNFPKVKALFDFIELKEIKNSKTFITVLLDYLKTTLNFLTAEIERKCLYVMINELIKIKGFIDSYAYHQKISISVISRVLISKWSNLTIPFYGEPLAGVQVMGFLESRTLDFKHVILLSCNEADLPGSEFDASFIPADLKKHYQLPGTYEKDAMFGYYFYRAIQRAEKIDLIYSTSSSSKIGSAEPSRYLLQLEKQVKSKQINLLKKETTFSYSTLTKKPIFQTPYSLNQLDQLFKRGLSPSSIKKYLDCPLDFYNRYVIKLKEPDQVEETMENSTWGNILHLTLKNLFKENQLIDLDAIQTIRTQANQQLKKEFELKFPDGRFNKGQNALMYFQAQKCLEAFFNNEHKNIIKNGNYKILGLEKKVEHTIEVLINDKKTPLRIKGDIDRIDQTKEGIRIVDYKSGFIKNGAVSLKNFNAFKTQNYSLQLITYAYLYHKQFKEDNLTAAIVSLKNPKGNFIYFSFNNNKVLGSALFSNYENYIADLVQQMTLENQEFKHNSKNKYCMIC